MTAFQQSKRSVAMCAGFGVFIGNPVARNGVRALHVFAFSQL
jgi:hypothetical protein